MAEFGRTGSVEGVEGGGVERGRKVLKAELWKSSCSRSPRRSGDAVRTAVQMGHRW